MKQLPQTIHAAESADACAAALLDALPGVVWFVRRQMRSRRGKRLSVPQFRTLVQLHRCPAATLYAVAEKLGSSLPTVSRIVSRLVAHGLVDRRACAEDRRCISLVLTSRGRATLEAALAGTRWAMAEKLAGLDAPDRAALARAAAVLSDVFACTGNKPSEPCGSPARPRAAQPRNTLRAGR